MTDPLTEAWWILYNPKLDKSIHFYWYFIWAYLTHTHTHSLLWIFYPVIYIYIFLNTISSKIFFQMLHSYKVYNFLLGRDLGQNGSNKAHEKIVEKKKKLKLVVDWLNPWAMLCHMTCTSAGLTNPPNQL